LGPSLQPPLVTFGARLCALVAGCLELPPSTAYGIHLPAVLDEDGPDRLLIEGMPGGDIEEFLCGLWLLMTELMHQGSAVHARPEHRDDVGVTDPVELMALSGETLDVIPHGFALHMLAALQIPRVARAHVGALEVFGEDLLEILPTINQVSRQVIEPSPGRIV
jgi:hypothetical protein